MTAAGAHLFSHLLEHSTRPAREHLDTIQHQQRQLVKQVGMTAHLCQKAEKHEQGRKSHSVPTFQDQLAFRSTHLLTHERDAADEALVGVLVLIHLRQDEKVLAHGVHLFVALHGPVRQKKWALVLATQKSLNSHKWNGGLTFSRHRCWVPAETPAKSQCAYH